MKTINEMYQNLSGKAKLAIAAGAVVASGLVGYAIGEKSGYARRDNELFQEWLGADPAFNQAVAREMEVLGRFERQIDGLAAKLKDANEALNNVSGSQSFEQWMKEKSK